LGAPLITVLSQIVNDAMQFGNEGFGCLSLGLLGRLLGREHAEGHGHVRHPG
jgi:hypothetical protein